MFKIFCENMQKICSNRFCKHMFKHISKHMFKTHFQKYVQTYFAKYVRHILQNISRTYFRNICSNIFRERGRPLQLYGVLVKRKVPIAENRSEIRYMHARVHRFFIQQFEPHLLQSSTPVGTLTDQFEKLPVGRLPSTSCNVP